LLDKGDAKELNDSLLEDTSKTLLKYFLIGLTLSNDSFWVNLRPDSPDNIIDDYLAQTDIGKIMLEADLQLKKDTAKATSPETPEGKEYWDRLYKKAGEIFGYGNVTIPTLTRPWIVPNEIIIGENTESAYVYKATLKVMLEQDYLKDSAVYNFEDTRLKELNEYSSQLIRELIIPKLTMEINTSKRYAPLRQVYYSLILAQWFKARFANKDTTYSRLINRKDLTNLSSKEPWSKTTYFKQYQKSFKDGECNISEPVYTPYGQTIRSYFSGGISGFMTQRQMVQELAKPMGDAANKVVLPEAPVTSSPILSDYLLPAVGNTDGEIELTHEHIIEKGASSSPTDLPDASWETTMTNPSSHNKGKFRYLVHAVELPESTRRVLQKIAILEKRGNDREVTSNHIELLENPARIGDKPIISTSLIDAEHRHTWIPGGFILRVPRDNILKAALRDARTLFFGGKEIVKELYAERDALGIVSPDVVLETTAPHTYNEVVVTGTGRTGKRVEITGVFIKVSSNGEPINSRLAEQLKTLADRYGWPIIEITESFIPYRDSNPDEYIQGGAFAFNRGGKRYLFETFDTESSRFTTLEEGGR
jgi:hypothetical protein